MKTLLLPYLAALILFVGGPAPAEATGIGFGIHIGNGGGNYGSWNRPVYNDWNSGWRSEWRDPWRSGWRHEHRYDSAWRRGYETRRHLGFEITTPAYDPYDSYNSYGGYYDRWHDPYPEWNDSWSGTHWYSGEPRFDYRAEPRRPLPPPPAPPAIAAPAPAPAPEPAQKKKVKVVMPAEEDDEDEFDDGEGTLHYCPSARGYYPAVRECPGGWQLQTGKKVQ